MEKQEEFVERMIEEQKALKEKIVKLNAFIVDQKFNQLDDYNKSLLIRQREGMAVYFETLTARISLNLK
jgi:hypothetical protein